GVPAAVSVLSLARLGRAFAAAAAVVHFRAGRAARRSRLVDGGVRPRRAGGGLTISPRDSSPARLPDLRGDHLHGAADGRARGAATAGTGSHSRRRHRARSTRARANLSWRAGCRIARRLRLQHLAADRWRTGAGCGAALFRYSVVAQFLREYSHRAV